MQNYKNSLVSVIVPAYNAEKYISECVSSVLNQTYSDWEMIIIDDGSTDNTIDIIKEFENEDQRISLYKMTQNGGVARARRKALEMANGQYIAFLDSDDMWKSQKLEKQLRFMKYNNLAFSMTSYEILSKGKTNKKIFKVPSRLSYEDYLKNTIIGNLTVMVDRKLAPDFRIQDSPLEDVMTWMEFLKKGNIAYGLDENLAIYRVTDDSVSSDKIDNAKKYFKLLKNRQKLGYFKSTYYFVFYVYNAIKKRYLN